eukprot:s1218_g11.t1
MGSLSLQLSCQIGTLLLGQGEAFHGLWCAIPMQTRQRPIGCTRPYLITECNHMGRSNTGMRRRNFMGGKCMIEWSFDFLPAVLG